MPDDTTEARNEAMARPDGPGASRSATGAEQVVSAHSGDAPSRDQFINWIADRFQQRHTPDLPRDQAIEMAGECLFGMEEMTAPFGDANYDWGEDAAHDMADEDIHSGWEAAS